MNVPVSNFDRVLLKVMKATGIIALCVAGFYAIAWLFLPRESPYRRLSTATISNMKQAATAVLLYASDYDDRLPHSFHNESSLYFILGSKNADKAKTLNPNGGSFMPNANLAGVFISDIEEPERTVLIYETQSWPNRDRRFYSFVDGSARSAPMAEPFIWGAKP